MLYTGKKDYIGRVYLSLSVSLTLSFSLSVCLPLSVSLSLSPVSILRSLHIRYSSVSSKALTTQTLTLTQRQAAYSISEVTTFWENLSPLLGLHRIRDTNWTPLFTIAKALHVTFNPLIKSSALYPRSNVLYSLYKMNL